MKSGILFLTVLILVACQSTQSNIAPGKQFDDLESIFSNANWEMADPGDTSYFYFSRVGEANFKVYEYRMINGDSVLQDESIIRPEGKAILWFRKPGSLKLIGVDSVTAKWSRVQEEESFMEFTRISDSTVQFAITGEKKTVMKKTLPLATFLVRSRYDFLHGTHTVDSPLVPHRGKELE